MTALYALTVVTYLSFAPVSPEDLRKFCMNTVQKVSGGSLGIEITTLEMCWHFKRLAELEKYPNILPSTP